MRWHRPPILAAVLALLVPASTLARAPRKAARPRAFASCARLVGYERAHFAATRGVPESSPRPLLEPPVAAPPASGRVPAPAAAPGGSAAAGESSFSTTNNQEPGVEEPDIVKSDGSTIFALEQGRLYAVAAGPPPHLAGSLSLGSGGYGAELLIRGSRLLVVSASVPAIAPGAPLAPRSSIASPGAGAIRPASPTRAALPAPSPAIVPSPYFYPATTTVTEVDARDPAEMRVTRTMTVEGTFVDARQNGGTARLVIASAPRAIAAVALRGRPSGWVPARRFHSFITGHRYSRPVASCSEVRRPAQFSGLGTLTILTIDLDRGLYATGSDALIADAQIVYGSQSSLYVATQRWVDPSTPAARLPGGQQTVIDRFDASGPDATPLVASGTVPGYLLNQFSLSEYRGLLRVASTSEPIWWDGAGPPASESRVTVLADRGQALVPIGQVSGLGSGQQIYSVRFIGDAGYVVTFRQVDPLYTLDLSSPTAPRVAGQLELEGYSAYLHPVGEGLLLGLGREVGPGNEPSGTQLELFDVSNPAAPRLQARTSLGAGSSSDVQFDHHAFLFWPPDSLAVVPVSIYPTTGANVPPSAPTAPPTAAVGAPAPQLAGSFVGAVAYRVQRSGIVELARIAHDPIDGYAPAIARSLVLGGQLFTVSSAGVMSSSLATLEREAFVAFGAPAPLPQPTGSAGSATAGASSGRAAAR